MWTAPRRVDGVGIELRTLSCDVAAWRPLGHPGAVLGGVAVLVPGLGIFALVTLGGHLGFKERVHRRVGLVRGALVVDAVRRIRKTVADLFNEKC